MRIVDAKTQQETSDSQIGQNLQLIIELKEKSSNAKTSCHYILLLTLFNLRYSGFMGESFNCHDGKRGRINISSG